MSETILKLIKQLANNPQAKRVADTVRLKIDKFKVYLPVLDAICQQGLNERHWTQISEEIGQTVNPELFPTLSAMIDIDILRIVDRLKEIANAAAKEYELNLQLTNMQTEWMNVAFELIQYRSVNWCNALLERVTFDIKNVWNFIVQFDIRKWKLIDCSFQRFGRIHFGWAG